MHSLVLTVIGPDRPGLVDSLAEIVAAHQGNWLESRMAHLGGKFAGILHVVVPEQQTEALLAALETLGTHGLSVHAERDTVTEIHQTFRPVTLELLGNDRPGIVREVSHALAGRGVNVEEFRTECIDAPMSGGTLFRATAQLRLPPDLAADDLRHQLEQLAHDLMVDISLNEPD
ncbi:MAG: glycine cleavage system protein R [Planctomycetales bacterium]|nr:glycine cleavage system protein R [Planctomycetales bacterium]NIO34998.1 glycine cleavage system protein R [Planctomycetales bacterium]NIP69962.1 glycine cleavage system protein R [Planctomycetales bacterium]